MRLFPLLAIASLTFGISGCRGKVLGTAALTGPGTADVTFTSTGAPVVLWADTDGKWTGGEHSHFPAKYEIDVTAGAAKVGHVSCATTGGGTSVCGSRVSTGSTSSGDCEVKLDCTLPTTPAGPVTLHVTASTGNGVIEVRKLSLNVRDK